MKSFHGYGLGSYSFFNQGMDIFSATAFSVPDTPGVQLHDVFTRFLNGLGGIDHVVNDTGAPVPPPITPAPATWSAIPSNPQGTKAPSAASGRGRRSAYLATARILVAVRQLPARAHPVAGVALGVHCR